MSTTVDDCAPATDVSLDERDAWVRRHLLLGWGALALFACVGTCLEALHGFKIGAYLDVGNETRRLMWRLGHAHGALIGIVHILWAMTLAKSHRALPWVSRSLTTALVMLPAGFLIGGGVLYGGDPGIGIFLVPPGALVFVFALFGAARASASVTLR